MSRIRTNLITNRMSYGADSYAGNTASTIIVMEVSG